MASVLVVEDEAAIAELIAINLRHASMEVTVAGSAADAQAEVDHELPDLVILDWMLPGQSGLLLARHWRAQARTRALPIIMLTARAEEGDKIAGLDAGADDYLTKPFGVAELHARLRVARRNSAQFGLEGRTLLTLGAVVIDLHAKTITRAGEGLRLTAMQWRLLEALARHAGSVVTSGQLLREVWGPGHLEQGHYLRIFVRQLRQRLEDDPSHPRFLVTETGIGYRLLFDPAADLLEGLDQP